MGGKICLINLTALSEKWMALVTPACLLFGVLFPDIAKHGLPYVSLVFAFMTFTGALKSDFHDMARVLKHPIPLLACLGVLHVLLPVLAWRSWASAFSWK